MKFTELLHGYSASHRLLYPSPTPPRPPASPRQGEALAQLNNQAVSVFNELSEGVKNGTLLQM